MYELPLFPLNTVLFPGMPLTLHIFEARYKAMIQRCVDSGEKFGVVLIRQGDEALGPVAEPYFVGCAAEIMKVQPLKDGRMNILAVGRERFRVQNLNKELAYLTGMVESFPLDMLDYESAQAQGQLLLPWVERYLTLLGEVGEVSFDLGQLPAEPKALAYLAAAVLQTPAGNKQTLLATAETTQLLSRLRKLYRQEVPLLRTMIEAKEQQQDGPAGFSLN